MLVPGNNPVHKIGEVLNQVIVHGVVPWQLFLVAVIFFLLPDKLCVINKPKIGFGCGGFNQEYFNCINVIGA
jgi:hypothetical protein